MLIRPVLVVANMTLCSVMLELTQLPNKNYRSDIANEDSVLIRHFYILHFHVSPPDIYV